MAPSQPPSSAPRPPWGVPIAVAVIVGGLLSWRACDRYNPPRTIAPKATPIDSGAPLASSVSRCVDVSEHPFLLGEGLPRAKAPSSDAAPDDDVDELVPYAVEVGRGAHYEGGFAVGMTREQAVGTEMMIATVGLDGRGGATVPLGRSRGDLDPPVVAGAGESVLVAVVEPNAGGRGIKVAKVTGSAVTWGPELSEGRDDSLAVDLAAAKDRAVVVWDDVRGATDATRRSNVLLASFDVRTMRLLTPAHPVSPPKSDAASPRVVPRPGGYWLAYLVHGEDGTSKKPVARGEAEEDDTPQGEAIVPAWVEVAPLDEAGTPTATPKAVTPKQGFAASFDVELADSGGVLVLVRDDDAPSGAAGGKLTITLMTEGGVSDARLVEGESEGTGVPTLLRGWVAVASGTGATRIAALGSHGELLDELSAEPTLGVGQPIASTSDGLLWARPEGKGMRLSVIRCARHGVATVDSGP